MKENIKDSMSTDLVYIDGSCSMLQAYQKMQDNRIRHLPVIDDTGNIIGILSDRDVKRAMTSKLVKTDGILSCEKLEFPENATARDYMSWPVKTYDKNKPLKDVAKVMLKEKISSILVSDGSNIVGIITTDDLLRALIELLGEPRPARAWNLNELLRGSFKEVLT